MARDSHTSMSNIRKQYENTIDILQRIRYAGTLNLRETETPPADDSYRTDTADGAHEIGSDVYTKMFEGAALSEKEKAELPIRQMGGYMDAAGMLQLKNIEFRSDDGGHIVGMQAKDGGYCFAPDMGPYSTFWKNYARSVQMAYGKEGLDSELVHQFRMYIDLYNITYVRGYYKKPGMTDEEALAAYVQAELGGKKMKREGARFHNKFPQYSTYEDYKKGRENKKRLTPDYHSEFIIDPSGSFVSQWNVLEKDDISGRIIGEIVYYEEKYIWDLTGWEKAQEQILDTESFNYASSSGRDRKHKNLDIMPPGRYDTELRKSIKENWVSATVKEYDYHSDKGDAYSAT